MMKRLRTDYIDYGFTHCLDEDKDLDAYIKGVSKAVFSIIFLKNSKMRQTKYPILLTADLVFINSEHKQKLN